MKTFVCVGCGETGVSKNYSKRKYCSNACQGKHKNRQLVEKWLGGEVSASIGDSFQLKRGIRRAILTERGTACSVCGWDEKHPVDGLPLTEIDHIDGNASNNNPDNLRVLCPNCHSMTPTYRARNKNSKRKR